jgi:ABC-type antimicrobial peptide transport system permease subunit
MFKHHLKLAFRQLTRNKFHSFINISGLSIGIAVALLIGLWAWDELSFDSYHKNQSSIAQIARKENINGEIFISENNNTFPVPLAGELKTAYSHYFEHVALASLKGEHILSADEKQFIKQGMYVEPDFIKMFSFKMIAGSPNALDEPLTILLNATLARSFFGNAEDAIGKVVKIDNKRGLKVTGVFEDSPNNTSFSDINFFCTWRLLAGSIGAVRDNLTNWQYSAASIYVQPKAGLSMDKVTAGIKDIYWPKIKDNQPASANSSVSIFLLPMKDWHLRSEWKNGVQSGGRIQLVWLFSIIGIFMLLLGCINFVNLSTARSEKRAKEVGIRKTIGSLRSQLISQFLSESFIVVLIAFLVGMGLVLASLNWFNGVAEKDIQFPFANPLFWLVCLTFVCVTAFIAGSYPALYLSSFQPVKVLKGLFRVGGSTAIPRRVLVGLQFTISILLIIGTLIVYRQLQHAKNRPLGYDKNGLIRITMNTPNLSGKYDILQKELIESGAAVGYAQSSSATTHINDYDGRFDWEGREPNAPQMSFALMAVTYDFGKTVGWQFLQGRDFSRDFAATDATGIILNETAIKYMGLKDPINKTVKWNGNAFTVVGVIKDMITESPYAPVQQSAFLLVPNVGPIITIRLNPKLSISQAISKIEPVFRKYNPASPFDFQFVDKDYNKKFATEQRIGTLASFFAIFTIFISCLGIFGLASFIAEQRTKEIGVRKILGASVLNLWGLLSKEFVLLVGIAFLIAAPIAYYFMNKWLQQYEYRTNIAWWIFLVAGGGALVITLFTVSFQSLKAAMMKPSKSLKTE